MDTLTELRWLIRATGSLWWRRLPVLGMWFCLGWVGRELTTQIAVLLGANLVAATLFLVAGMLIWVVGIVFMVHGVADEVSALRPTGASPVAEPLSRKRVLLDAVLPFLAVYAVWGLTEEHVQRAFNANIAFHGVDVANFSITFAAWQLYLAIAVVAWIAQAILTPILSGRGGLGAATLMTFLRGTSILTAFMGVSQLLVRLLNWSMGRQFWYWGAEAWHRFIELLPDWQLPWQLSLPETVRAAASTLWTTLAPGLLEAVALPLVWLALIAMVFGWSDLGATLTPGRLATRAGALQERIGRTRLASRLTEAERLSPAGAARAWFANQIDDLRPAVQALRLVMRSGWWFLAAYLVLGAFIRALDLWLRQGVMWLVGSRPFAETMRYLPVVELGAEFVSWTLAVALYVVAFDRALLRARSLVSPPDAPQTHHVAG